MATVASLSSLLKQTHITSHSDVLTAANTTLKTSKSDTTAQHSRIVALLHLERYADAVKACEEGGEDIKKIAATEYAYALYKAGQWEEAAQVAEAAGGRDSEEGLSHILAQTAYRLERFDEAAALYDRLAKDSDSSDIRIQRGAVDAQLEWQGSGHLVIKKKPTREDLEAFESAYNAACASIARGELGQAEILLRRSKDLLSALPDLTDAEKTSELLPINAQHIYVLLRQGRADEAAKLSQDVPIHSISDKGTQRIASVNGMVSSSSTSNPYLLHRQFNHTPKLAKNDTPFEYQASVLQQNGYVTDLLALKHSGVIASANAVLQKDSQPSLSPATNSVSALRAAAQAQNQTGKEALAIIVPSLQQSPNNVGLILTIVQLYIMANNHASAILLLEGFLGRLEKSGTPKDMDVRFSPGLVGTIVALYNLQGRSSVARSELSKAAEYWRSKSKEASDPTKHATLLKAAGTALLHSDEQSDLEAAASIFDAIHKQDSADKAASAGLISALARTDPAKIQKADLDSLTATSRLIAGIDVAALEDAGVARPDVSMSTASTKKRPADDANKSAKPKKIRKSKMPKDFDPNKKIDPERWLPMRDRSYWKPKGKKGKARQAGLTQGGPVAEEKAAPQQATPSAGGGGAASKKKKKGKR